MAFSALFWAGCAKPPLAEMDAAESAVIRAENDSDVVSFAGSSLARAREALTRMREEAASKRYDAAKNYAAEAVAAANKAISDGRTASARAREDAAALLATVKDSLEDTGHAIDNAKAAGNIDLDFTGVDTDFDTARRTTDQAEVSLAGNKYQDSMEKSRTARGILGDISARIAGAAATVSRKK
ncbi:MAG: DUF4398 domain-containing protein [Treponema sp.]|jgi:hypothetical protein|nr:DUF4398 domain-containing protein [Treponema sp.]